jgi:acyl carrier protein
MTKAELDLSPEGIREHIYVLIIPYNTKAITLHPDTTFSGDLELDSLTVMDLVAAIEDHFDIVLPLNMLPDLETIQQVAEAVEKIVGEK